MPKTIRTVRSTDQENTPKRNYERLERLSAEMQRLRPYHKPRGIVYKFKTWEELEAFSVTRAAMKR